MKKKPSNFKRPPLVSIIMPTFNVFEFINTTIESVLAQTYEEWELIIIDDCSSDETSSIVKSILLSESRIKFYQLNENKGVAHARNFAIERASGRFVAFLDGDDVWLPNKLEVQIGIMLASNIAFSFTEYCIVDGCSKLIGHRTARKKVEYRDLLAGAKIGCSTVVIDTTHVRNIYFPKIKMRNDLGCWLSILKDGIIAYGISVPLTNYRKRKNSLSAIKWVAIIYTWKLLKNYSSLSTRQVLFYFILVLTKSIIFACLDKLNLKLRKPNIRRTV